MARPLWKGTINFGLVNIPIQLYTAVKKHVIGFRLLHEKCGNPVMNKRWCPYCDEEVAWNHILKGLRLKDGSYFVLDPDNLNKLKPVKTNAVSIVEFVDSSQIYSLYIDEHYYAGPNNVNDKTYTLFCEALKKSKLVAVGQFVMRDKEHVCVIEPYNSILLLTTLHFSYEIQDDSQIIPEKSKALPINKQELALANLLIDKLYNDKFDLTKYKDTFAQKILKALTSEKGKKALTRSLKNEKAKKTESTSLVDLLQASVNKK